MTVSTPPSPGPGGDQSADPSMEDILASIRRILSEDEAKPGSLILPNGAPLVVDAHSVPDAPDDVLLLSTSMLIAEPSTPPASTVPAEKPPAQWAKRDPVAGDDQTQVAPPEARLRTVSPAAPPPLSIVSSEEPSVPAPAPAPAAGETLVAPETAAAAAVSVGALLRHLQVERQTQVHRGGPTIEDIVREEMRPLLKQWLDTHMPPMVERLVRAEIERVVGSSIS